MLSGSRPLPPRAASAALPAARSRHAHAASTHSTATAIARLVLEIPTTVALVPASAGVMTGTTADGTTTLPDRAGETRSSDCGRGAGPTATSVGEGAACTAGAGADEVDENVARAPGLAGSKLR